jgi:broad specificity phosphatase PhoE
MLRIYLVRHGETDWNLQGRWQGTSDIPLNDKGLRQARQLAARLAQEENLTALYTSPLQRAFATADAIGKTTGLAPIGDERLVERRIGAFEGKTTVEIQAQFPEIYAAWQQGRARLTSPGEEPRAAFQARARSFVQDLRARYAEGNVVVVTHGGISGMLLMTILEMDTEKRFPFIFDNASLSIIAFEPPGPRIHLLNETCHLREPTPHTRADELMQDEKIRAGG